MVSRLASARRKADLGRYVDGYWLLGKELNVVPEEELII